MARYFDKVGFSLTDDATFVEGVWTEIITERAYKAEVLEDTSSIEPSDKVNDDIRLQNRIRIMADSFALEHSAEIKYVYWKGKPWTVTTVVEQRPRLTLSLGGVWSGQTPDQSSSQA